jgi:hypothetical protein
VNLSTLASLLLAACQAPASVTTPEPGETVMRVVDMGSLTLRTSDADLSDTVWPALSYDEGETGWDYALDVDEDAPARLLRLLFQRDFELVGNSIEYQGQGRFAIQAPSALHERIAKILPAAAAALGSELELELAFVKLDEPLQGAALVPDAQASALVEAAAKEGRAARRRFSLSSARPETFSQGKWVEVVTDYDVEVAQGTFVFDPITWRVQLGTRIALRAAPGKGGTHLALNLRRARATSEVSERFLTRSSRVGNEQQSLTETPDLLHQRLPILDEGLGLSTFLPEGQALAIASSQGSANLGEVLIVRRVSGNLARTARLGSGAESLLLVDLTAWAPPYVTSRWDEQGAMQRPTDPYSEGPSMTIGLSASRERGVDIASLIYNRVDQDESPIGNYEEFGPWLALAPKGDAALPDIEAEYADLAPDQRVVQVALTLKAPGGKAPIASLSLPLRAGATSSALLGVEDTYVGNVDVEVAQYASVEDPGMRALFDGVMLELEPRFALDGSLSLRLRGQASARDGEPQKHLLARGSVGEIETAAESFLMIAETLHFPAGQKTARGAVGDLADGLSLEVEVRY